MVHHFNSFQGYDDAFLTAGIHSLKFGIAMSAYQDNMLLTGATNAAFGSLTNFLTDKPSSYKGNLPGSQLLHETFAKLSLAYIQDDVRLRSALTVNLGLRYEMSTVPTEASGKLANLPTFTAAAPVVGNSPFSNPTLRNSLSRVSALHGTRLKLAKLRYVAASECSMFCHSPMKSSSLNLKSSVLSTGPYFIYTAGCLPLGCTCLT